ncbi:MAG: putative ArsR family transcriptional regulator [Gammaproteobacteria bacterium]|jgi:DNA-binding transcriptional ArsR family regulator|nr:putative ArsR family transcriptional regulator [Gammaproteobacteria bacterium]
MITSEQARELAGLFKMLGNETRARILHALVRAGELCVSELADAVAMKPQAISNQLQRLADRRVVATRREGTMIYYRIVDPCVAEIFERALCLLEDAESGVHTRAV